MKNDELVSTVGITPALFSVHFKHCNWFKQIQ